MFIIFFNILYIFKIITCMLFEIRKMNHIVIFKMTWKDWDYVVYVFTHYLQKQPLTNDNKIDMVF